MHTLSEYRTLPNPAAAPQPLRWTAYAVACSVLCLTTTNSPAADSPGEPSASEATLFDRLNQDGDNRLTASEIPPDLRRMFQRLLRTSDSNSDGALSRREFDDGTTPRRPEKPIETKLPTEFPGADALRVLVHKMDRDQDFVITEDEVPQRLVAPFQTMLQVADANQDRRLDRAEITRGGPRLTRMAMRAADRLEINVAREVRKVPQNLLRPPANDRARRPIDMLRDPERRAMFFARLDANGDDRLTLEELPEDAKKRFGRLIRAADRNRDRAISRAELDALMQRRRRNR